jgi:hypothetical protein
MDDMKNKSAEQFAKNGFISVKKFLDTDLLDLITQYALFNEIQNFRSERHQNRNQTPDAHSVYADPLMESLLLFLQRKIESTIELDLFPTYSYFRIYRPGDELEKHTDRESCEISATLCFNYDYKDQEYAWPIYMQNSEIEQSPGDIAIYKGCEIPHYRKKFQADDLESWHVQGFFHYVDANGKNTDWIYDKRVNIGYTVNTGQAKSKKSYIYYLL